jgi:alpha-L-rhamnosidase
MIWTVPKGEFMRLHRFNYPLCALALLSIIPLWTAGIQAADSFAAAQLRCEYQVNPLGIDVPKPRLSWQILADSRGWVQSAYQIQVAENSAGLLAEKELLWDSGKTLSGSSLHQAYNGPALQSAKRYHWRVRVWDKSGSPSPWSEIAWWEMGLLNPADWQTAAWIQPEGDHPKAEGGFLLRKEFDLPGPVEFARAYVSSLGLYELYLNGKRVGEQVLTPGWTSYETRVQYQTYDITPQLQSGGNAVGMMLAGGWYRGGIARNSYGDKLASIALLQIGLKDGRRVVVCTDGSWKSSAGPILKADIYNGETYDARQEKQGWNRITYGATDWQSVKILDHPKTVLIAPAGPPVRRIEEIKPNRILKTPAGDTVVDMGQNMVGWVRLKVNGPAGSTVRLRHAEGLDKEGNFYIRNLRAGKQTMEYILKGDGPEVFEPHFTFQGFRYVAVEGFPGDMTLDHLTGIVVHSDIAPTGEFECSNPMINQLQHNIRWGQKGNFVDVPTDCPQRDERLGWTGDAQAFARTASFNANVAAFYTKWLKDVAADQKESGAVPHVVPNVLGRRDPKANVASAGWADAAVIVPWTVYLCYGDTRILEQQYDSMRKWVEYMSGRAGESCFWNTDFTFGDWLAFATTRSDYPGATTDKDFIAQAYFARSTDLLQKIAVLLGKNEDAKKYAALLVRIKKVFADEFVTINGRLSSNTQTAYSLALGFDLLPEALRRTAAKRLAEDVRRFKHITTGFLGAPLICQVLSDNGYNDEAFLLLNRKEYPSWLYPITKGATTIWERWDGIKPDGSFQDEGMNSFNHYAYGAIGEWLYKFVAGLEIDERQPGYKHILIQPHTGGGLSRARARILSLYGPASSGWELQDGRMRVNIEVPPNTTASVRLPKARLSQVQESGKPLSLGKGITRSLQEESTAVLELGSGRYEFQYPVSE